MRCAEVSELMSLKLDGLASPNETARLDAHLAGCRECRVAWVALQEVSRMFESAPWLEPSSGFTERVMARIERQRSPLRVRGAVVLMVLSAVSSLIVTLALLGQVVPAVQELARTPAFVSMLEQFGSIARAVRTLAGVGLDLLEAVLAMVPGPVLVLYPLLAIMVALVWVFTLSRVQTRSVV